jgi:hypothetical protein
MTTILVLLVQQLFEMYDILFDIPFKIFSYGNGSTQMFVLIHIKSHRVRSQDRGVEAAVPRCPIDSGKCLLRKPGRQNHTAEMQENEREA